MENIDLKDRKILYRLAKDARQPFSKIGKKVGLPKNVVIYRVKRLQEKGIIKNYYTIIDTHKLGYTILRLYIKLQYTPSEVKKEIIEYFLKCKYGGVIHEAEGTYDLVIYLYVKNLQEFHVFWRNTMDKYRDYFETQILSFYLKGTMFDLSFLIDEERTDRNKIELFGDTTKVNIDDLDMKILHLLSQNARTPTVEIAKKLNSTTITVSKKINNLIKIGVIRGFSVVIDFSKLGYRGYRVDINLKEYKRRQQIINYITSNPNLMDNDETVGYADIQVAFYLTSDKELQPIIDDIASKFPNVIKNYNYFTVLRSYQWKFLPE